MDPISAMIGGMFSLGGGLFGANAAQQANAANIAQAQWQATGGYLPGLVANAQRAGINPLAVLPGGGGSANIQPVNQVGESLGQIGQNLSRMSLMTSPHDQQMQALDERRSRAAAENAELENIKLRHDISNTVGTPKLGHVVVGAPTINDQLRSGAGLRPGEKLDFPFNVLGQAGNLALSGFERGTAALGRWIGGDYAPGGSKY